MKGDITIITEFAKYPSGKTVKKLSDMLKKHFDTKTTTMPNGDTICMVTKKKEQP